MKINLKYKLRTLAGENVVFLQGEVEVKTSKLIALNEASVFLWNSFKDKDFTMDDVTNLILSEYDVDEETAHKDAQEWVDSLKNCGILE